MTRDDDLCEVGTYIDSLKANMVKGLLDNEGIKCILENVNTSNMNWLYTSAIGWLNLRVLKKDYEKAKEIINVFESNPEDEDKEECPECKSNDVKLINTHWFIGLVFILIFWIPSPFKKIKYKCNYCGKIWEIPIE
jgi:hypothetical protein